MAEPAVDYVYRYQAGSSIRPGEGAAHLRLATYGGVAEHPRLFVGRLLQPLVFADAILALGAVSRSRFHVPPAMLDHILLLADPVATVARDRLRFEAFSSCCSAYARLDLLPAATDGTVIGHGTTNVDLGADVRAALASVHDGADLFLSVGLDALSVEVQGASHEERRVPLASRWIRGFLEVQTIQASMRAGFEVDGGAARRFLHALARDGRRPIEIRTRGGELTVGYRPAAGSVAVGSPERLRLLERIASHVRSLRLFTSADGSTAWVAELPDARFTLVLSPEAWRGFSGEGAALGDAATLPRGALLARLRAVLSWQGVLDAEGLASGLSADPGAVRACLSALAASGLVGFDVAEGAYFHRALPFAVDRIERSQPRLRKARELVATGAVRIEQAAGPDTIAWVAGRNAEYRVRLSGPERACTCPWWGRHPGDRGPCAHVLAVELSMQATSDRP